MKDDWDGSHPDGVKVARQDYYSTGLAEWRRQHPELYARMMEAIDKMVEWHLKSTRRA